MKVDFDTVRKELLATEVVDQFQLAKNFNNSLAHRNVLCARAKVLDGNNFDESPTVPVAIDSMKADKDGAEIDYRGGSSVKRWGLGANEFHCLEKDFGKGVVFVVGWRSERTDNEYISVFKLM